MCLLQGGGGGSLVVAALPNRPFSNEPCLLLLLTGAKILFANFIKFFADCFAILVACLHS